MKKWYPFSAFLSLILAFVAVPLFQSVDANGNITGTARLSLVTSYISMDQGGKKIDCKQNGKTKCLILKYNIAGVDPKFTVTVGVHKSNCSKGPLLENLEANNIPVGDGRDGSEVIAHVNFAQIPNQQSLFFCVFKVNGSKDTVIAQGKFDLKQVSAIASVRSV